MIPAVNPTQSHRRHQTKSAASGLQFAVPDAALVAQALAQNPLPTQSSNLACTPSSTTTPPTSAVDVTSFLGRSVGSGQCVALVQAVQPSLGSSLNWRPGAFVQGNTALKPGTPIATFDPSSHYASATDGSSHAAIYLGQDAAGLHVLDQWAGSAAAVRTIPWTNAGGTAANTSAAFRVVTPTEA